MQSQDFEQISTLGKGAFSSVEKVRRKKDGQYYAMKKVMYGKLSDKEKENALNEIRLIASIDNPHIISFKEAFFDANALCIIMELAEGGDLLKKVEEHKKKGTSFNEGDIWRILIQMVKGLKALHELNIVYRDLKCANVFLTQDGHVKLGDFNVSKIAKKGLLCTQTGTPYYACPEVWKDKPYDCKSDIWSLGVVIYEVCALHPPFQANSMDQLYKRIIQGSYPPIPTRYSGELSNVIKMCLQQNPLSRPNCDKLLQMEQVNQKLTETLRKNDAASEKTNLIGTIKLDRNLKILQQHLPKPSYSRQESRKKTTERNVTTQQSARNQKEPMNSERVKLSIEEPEEKKAGFVRKVAKANSESTKAMVKREASLNLLNKEQSLECLSKHPVSQLKEIKEEKYVPPNNQKKDLEIKIEDHNHNKDQGKSNSPRKAYNEPMSAANKKPPMPVRAAEYRHYPQIQKYQPEYKSQDHGIKLPAISNAGRRDIIVSQKHDRPIIPPQMERPTSNRLGNAGANIIKGMQNPLADIYRRPPIILKDKENLSNVGITPIPKVSSEKIMQLYYSPAVAKASNPKYIPHYPANVPQRAAQKPMYNQIRPSWWG